MYDVKWDQFHLGNELMNMMVNISCENKINPLTCNESCNLRFDLCLYLVGHEQWGTWGDCPGCRNLSSSCDMGASPTLCGAGWRTWPNLLESPLGCDPCSTEDPYWRTKYWYLTFNRTFEEGCSSLIEEDGKMWWCIHSLDSFDGSFISPQQFDPFSILEHWDGLCAHLKLYSQSLMDNAKTIKVGVHYTIRVNFLVSDDLAIDQNAWGSNMGFSHSLDEGFKIQNLNLQRTNVW